MKMNIVLDEGARVDRAHPNDAGLDLFAMHGAVIPPCGKETIDTGVHAQIPQGYVGMIASKSGLMSKGITSRGTIDCGYTGSIKAVLYNHTHKPFRVEAGMKVTQLLIVPIAIPELNIVEELEATDRGDGGFGSTGR